jgi:hypothetical protein
MFKAGENCASKRNTPYLEQKGLKEISDRTLKVLNQLHMLLLIYAQIHNRI